VYKITSAPALALRRGFASEVLLRADCGGGGRKRGRSGRDSRTLAKDRRTKIYNIRLSGDESERFRRVAESRGLDVAQLVRMLVALADRSPDGRQLPPERADIAWEAAQQAFRQSGIAEGLPVHVVNTPHLQLTLVALAAAVVAAADAREGEAAATLNRFRIAVAAMLALNGRERGPDADTRGIWLAYLDAAREMFAWAARRARI
jgi:hypothetical protein